MNFKKIAAMFTATVLVCFGTVLPAFAEEVEETTEAKTIISEGVTSEDGLWGYSVIKDNTTGEEYALLESYTGSDTEVVIPSDVDGKTVRALGDYTFYENTAVTQITIPDSLTDFGQFPFFACSSLNEFIVDEGNDIYSVKDGILFGDNEQLIVCYPPAKPETEYTIPDGVVALNPGAFATCTKLKAVTFPETLERMGLYCFAECTSLNNVVIPEKVSELSQFNFTGCTSLTDITLPDTMHTIGDGAFFSCTALNSIEFPEYIIEIGQCAFVSTGFTEIEVPSTVQTIGYSAFGYTSDQSGQIIPMDSFTVKGVTGGAGQAYCGENEHVIFESTGGSTAETLTDTSEASESDTDTKEKDKEIKPGVIVGICAGGVVIITLAVILIVKLRKSSDDSDNDDSDNEEK